MSEQSPHERQPKVRRAGSDDVEELRAGATHAGSTTNQARQAAPEGISEKLSRPGEEASEATHHHVEGRLKWPFQATQVAEEWVHFFGRTLERNSRAAADLKACNSVASLLRWHWDLVQSNSKDWLETSFAVFGAFCAEGSHAQGGD